MEWSGASGSSLGSGVTLLLGSGRGPAGCRGATWELWDLRTKREGGLGNSEWSRVRMLAAPCPCSVTVRGTSILVTCQEHLTNG